MDRCISKNQNKTFEKGFSTFSTGFGKAGLWKRRFGLRLKNVFSTCSTGFGKSGALEKKVWLTRQMGLDHYTTVGVIILSTYGRFPSVGFPMRPPSGKPDASSDLCRGSCCHPDG